MKKEILILFGIIVFSLFLSFCLIKIYGLSVPSQCYTSLQVPQYFTTKSPLPITTNSLDNYLKIDYIGDDLFTLQAANTGSMRPAIPDYSILIMIKPSEENIKIGDIISIKRENGKNLIHRVINIENISGINYYTTKGDNNVYPDSKNWVYDDMEGKVVGVLY